MHWGPGDVSHLFVIYFSCPGLSRQQSQFYYRAIFFHFSTDSSVTLLLPRLLTLPDKCVRLEPHEANDSCFMRQCVQNIIQNVYLLNKSVPDDTQTSNICFFLYIFLLFNLSNSFFCGLFQNCIKTRFNFMSVAYKATVQYKYHVCLIKIFYNLLRSNYLTPWRI